MLPVGGQNVTHFCEELDLDGASKQHPDFDDLTAMLAEFHHSNSGSNLSITRFSDRDSVMEAIRSEFGVGIFGCEDSDRGCFAFYFAIWANQR